MSTFHNSNKGWELDGSVGGNVLEVSQGLPKSVSSGHKSSVELTFRIIKKINTFTLENC